MNLKGRSLIGISSRDLSYICTTKNTQGKIK